MEDAVEVPKEVIISAIKKVGEIIGEDLANLVSFDQEIVWQAAFKVGKDERIDLLSDKSTIGSIANVLCRSTRYLPPTEIQTAYSMLDALMEQLFRRRDTTNKVWAKGEVKIYYTFKMVETLTNYLLYRSEEELSVTKQQLVRALREVLASDDILWSISDKLLKELKEIVGKQDFGRE